MVRLSLKNTLNSLLNVQALPADAKEVYWPVGHLKNLQKGQR
jgi:hypothetical protein